MISKTSKLPTASKASVLPEEPTNLQVMKNSGLAFETRMKAFETILLGKLAKMAECLPGGCGLTPERMMRLVLGTFRNNRDLLNCSPESIFLSINEAATLGLQLDSTLGHAYLVPYKTECKLMPGYKGLLDLARRLDRINVKTRCVYRGDHFEYEEGDADFIRHVPNDADDAKFDDEDVTHVYLIAKDLETGAVICRSVWSKARINAHKKKYSKNYSSPDSAWQTAWQTMARKTLVREAINRGELPVSIEVLRLSSTEEYHEAKAGDATKPVTVKVSDLARKLGSESNSIEAKFDDVPENELDEDPPFESDEPEQPFSRKQEQLPEREEDPKSETPDDSAEAMDRAAKLMLAPGEKPSQWEKRIGTQIQSTRSVNELSIFEYVADQMKEECSISEALYARVGDSIAAVRARLSR